MIGVGEHLVFLGNFGSGKSELAINFSAARARAGERVMLVDLDTINPYFRASERHEELAEAGVRLVGPTYALHRIEIMSLPAEVYAAFSHGGTVVFDAGGDPAGATALGQYRPYFDKAEHLSVLFVLNPMRPLASTAERSLKLLRGIEASSRLRVTGIVNNANLLDETTGEHLLQGYEVARALSVKTGIPVWATCGTREPLAEFLCMDGLDRAYIGAPTEIEINMRRDWNRYLDKGL